VVGGTCLKLDAVGKVKSVGHGQLLAVGEQNATGEERIFNGTVIAVV
jgi:hypothetical protein